MLRAWAGSIAKGPVSEVVLINEVCVIEALRVHGELIVQAFHLLSYIYASDLFIGVEVEQGV